jgi:hypothetical protein
LLTLCILIASALLGGGSAAADTQAPVFVLALANAESFERGLPVLRFAHEDLARFTKAMTRMGLLPETRVTTLEDASLASVRAAFADVAAAVRKAPGNSKLVFYYTGHSDATGLHLADGLLRKDELHALLGSVPATTRIAFLDGCYSGALAAKGIKPATDFVVPRAEFDEPSGSVFFAATSGTEVAFEVEEMRGSLFTHHLVDGLYGAADGNHDGLVTIDELYQYVYKQMSANTAALPGARPQKPEYDVNLHGRGALVLAYVARATAPVVLAADLVGDLTLAADGGLSVFHVTKAAAEETRLQLAPGDYSVQLRHGDQLGRGMLMVQAGRTSRLALRDLVVETAPDLDVVAKGQRPLPRWSVAAGVQNSSFTRTGPSAEALVATPAVRVEASEWRLVAAAGGHRNDLSYREQAGTSTSLSALVGARASIEPAWTLAGEDISVLIGGGADYTWQHWATAPGAPPPRRFQATVPKIAAGVGTSLTLDSGRSIGIAYRREFPFAKDAVTGDVLAFGANVFNVFFEW